MSLNIKFYDGAYSQIEIPSYMQKGGEYTMFTPSYFIYQMYWKNVRTDWNNQILYLNTAGTVFILIPEGCYFIKDLNDGPLLPQIGVKYYKILSPPGSSKYYIYSYSSVSDRANNINGVQEVTQGFSNLNAEIYNNFFEPTAFKLRSELFDTLTNTKNESTTLTRTGDIIIPVSVA